MLRVGMRAVFAVGCLLSVSRGAQPDGDGPKFLELEVSVVAPDGSPVSGATITPWALGSSEGHGPWREEVFGKPESVKTDNDGRARIRYPAEHFNGAATLIVSVFVDHPQFVYETLHLQTPAGAAAGSWGEPPEIKLRTGTKLRAAVIRGESEELLPDAHILRIGVPPAIALFHAGNDGWFESRPLPAEWKWLRAVWLDPEGPPLFSERYQWLPDDPETHEFVLSAKPGVRLEGRLDPAVPPPVTGGRVCLFVTDPLTEPQDIVWADVAEIADDGTFVFESLPPDCDAQIVATCDGYYSPSPPEHELLASAARYGQAANVSNTFNYLQMFTLDQKVVSATIAMSQTAAARVRVVDPEGAPVSNVLVEFWPNQLIVGYGSMIYAKGFRMASILQTGKYPVDAANWFSRTTDENGWCEFKNLLPGNWSFGVQSPDLQTEYPVAGGEDAAKLTLSVDGPLERTIVLAKRPE